MASRKKTFREKLDDPKDFPRVQPLAGKMQKRFGEGTILLPAPQDVVELMRKVPRGKLTTVNAIRETLAARYGATVTCPIVAGIYVRIVAGAAGEEEDEGKRRVTPYWRTLKSKGDLNEKYPGGVERQRERLAAEGHEVVARGKRLVVRDFEQALA